MRGVTHCALAIPRGKSAEYREPPLDWLEVAAGIEPAYRALQASDEEDEDGV